MRGGAVNLPLLLHEASQALSQPCQGKMSIKLSVGCHSRWRQDVLGTEAACECKMHHPLALWMRSVTTRRGKWRCSCGLLPYVEPLLRGWHGSKAETLFYYGKLSRVVHQVQLIFELFCMHCISRIRLLLQMLFKSPVIAQMMTICNIQECSIFR